MAITDVILDDKDELTLPASPADYIYILRQVAGGGFSITDYKINVRNLLGDALPYSSDGLVPDPAAGTQYFNTATSQMRGYDGSSWHNMFNTEITSKISLSAAEIKTLGTTPIDAIAAQGAGTAIIIKNVFVKLTWGSVAFDDVPVVIDIDGSNGSWQIAKILARTADNVKRASYPSSTVSGDDILENTKVTISGTDSVATGDSTLDAYITYEVITL